MTGYSYHRNTSVMHASANIEAVRHMSNDERRAAWSAKYSLRGFHRGEGKPRIRVRDGQVIRVTVPQPLTPVPDHEQPAPTRAIGTGSPMPAAAGQHDSPSRVAAAGSLPQREPAARVGTPADASPFPAPVGVQATGNLSGE